MKVEIFDTLPSTNQYCELLDLSQVEEFAVFFARQQTKGVGQRGHYWVAEAGKNITCSVILKPCWLSVPDQYQLTKVVSLGVVHCLSRLLPTTEDIRIKWPNDIYVGQQKICGILISNKLQRNRMATSIVGIGLNVNQDCFPDWVPNPISLKMITGREFPLDETLDLLVDEIENLYVRYRGNYPSAAWLDEEYLASLLNRGVVRHYHYRGRDIHATLEGVNRFGHLQLTTVEGCHLSCQMSEIQLVV